MLFTLEPNYSLDSNNVFPIFRSPLNSQTTYIYKYKTNDRTSKDILNYPAISINADSIKITDGIEAIYLRSDEEFDYLIGKFPVACTSKPFNQYVNLRFIKSVSIL